MGHTSAVEPDTLWIRSVTQRVYKVKLVRPHPDCVMIHAIGLDGHCAMEQQKFLTRFSPIDPAD